MNNQKGGIWLWVLLVVVVLGIAYLCLIYFGRNLNPYRATGLSSEDTTEAIEKELQATDFGDLDKELQQTEADLNSL